MFYLFSIVCLIRGAVIIIVKNNMRILLTTMLIMLNIIVISFLKVMDYWCAYLILLSFLVGLFLLFVYIVSLDSFKVRETGTPFYTSFSTLLMFFLLNFTWINSHYLEISVVQEKTLSQKNMNWLYMDSNEIIIISIILFSFFIIFLFFFMKKNKKIIKSSH